MTQPHNRRHDDGPFVLDEQEETFGWAVGQTVHSPLHNALTILVALVTIFGLLILVPLTIFVWSLAL